MLRITFDNNGTGLQDITLQLGNSMSVMDSNGFPNSTSEWTASKSENVVKTLLEMLHHWVQSIESLQAEGEQCFLPAGRSGDRSIWFRSTRVGEEFELQLGQSLDAGMESAPHPWATCEQEPPGFQICGGAASAQLAPVRMSRHELHHVIARQRKTFLGLAMPRSNPTPIMEHFRGAYATQLLTAAVIHFDFFSKLKPSMSKEELGMVLGLQQRPLTVLLTALKALGLVEDRGEQGLWPTLMGEEHLTHGGMFSVTNYLGLAADAPGVVAMVERLKSNRPAGLDTDESGAAFIYRDGMRSAMEETGLARHFTLSLAGRAKNVAPVLADRYRLHDAQTLLDIGGGSGIYAIAYLVRNHHLRAIVLDRPEVLEVAAEFAEQFGVEDRLELLPGDMFADPFPAADVMLLSNILHDWDIPECRELVSKCSAALPDQGRLLIHDVFLNDDHAGPLPIALYSAALFTLTEGRAYSAGEYSSWMREAGLSVRGPVKTLVHCGVLSGQKNS